MRSAERLSHDPSLPSVSAAEGLDLLRTALARLPARTEIRRIVLAVSGGPDSLALLLLTAENLSSLRAGGFEPVVATVDHGLRSESLREAEEVARLCRRLGLPHRILFWLGRKPAGNLAAEARAARYRLLAAHAEEVGASAILTAHHEDDQIETHFLAAARGAGDRGLAGMRPIRILEPGLFLMRPFLPVPGSRLKATTTERGFTAADDPSNRDPRFDRARLRAGLRLDAGDRAACLARIATHAERRAREDEALAAWTGGLVATGALSADAYGRVVMSPLALAEADAELVDRLLSVVIRAVAGSEHPPSRLGIRRLAQRLMGGGDIAATLGGSVVHGNAIFTFMREYGRSGIENVDASERCRVSFDRRFKLFNRCGNAFAPGSRIVALGSLGRGNAAERTLPVLIGGDGEVLAVPALLGAKFPPQTPRIAFTTDVGPRLSRDLGGFSQICTKS